MPTKLVTFFNRMHATPEQDAYLSLIFESGVFHLSALFGMSRRDARQLTERGLERAYGDWLAQEADQWAREDAAVCAEED